MFRNIDDDLLQSLIKESSSISEILRKLNLVPCGANHRELSLYIYESNIFDTSTLVGRKICRNKKERHYKLLSDILKEDVNYSSNKLKKRLISEGIFEYKCEKCGISEWLDNDITLELHHINGKHNDNRLSNLQILCPNCHSQTKNYKGKAEQRDKIDTELKMIKIIENEKIKFLNRKKREKESKIQLPKRYCKVCGKELDYKHKYFCSFECYKQEISKDKPNKDELINTSKEVTSFIEMGKYYNVCDNSIRKWCKEFNILNIVRNNFKSKSLKVIQYTLNGEFVKKWDSAKVASNELNFKKENIQQVCNGYKKTCGGYIWKYEKV